MFHVALLLVPFVFMVWPFLLSSRNRRTERYVSLSLALISCLLAGYMLISGITVDGVSYETQFLVFLLIPLMFYYLYLILVNVTDGMVKERRPIY